MKTINIDKDDKIVLDTQSNETEININKCKVIISDLLSNVKRIKINQGELDYCLIKKGNEEIETTIDINGGKAVIRIIDLYSNDSEIKYNINLEKENSEAEFYSASIANNKVNKNFFIKTNNNVRDTKVKIDCFGISEDISSIKYDITSYIKKGAKQASVNQNSKILLFDKESKGVNNPILEIEENDVKANHGSSIGMIDEDTLFYLTSRGIKESDARSLVSLGKVNYLINEVKDDKVREALLKEITERV